MAIRLSGINSGMDTDAMVQELVKASSTKKNDLVKAKTKLQWKQDAWKDLNTKIYSFFNKYLDNMKYQGSYNKKSTTVADSSIASVVASANAINGSQSLVVKSLAKSAYLTGGKINSSNPVKAGTTMKDLGVVSGNDKATITLTVGGKDTDIEVTGDMTITQLTDKMKAAGVEANFDVTNQRFFISAKTSGSAGDFSISSKDGNGQILLSSLGLATGAATDAETLAWAAMKGNTDTDTLANVDFQSRVSTEAARRIGLIQAANTENQRLLDELKTTEAYNRGMNVEGDTIEDKIANIQKNLKENDEILTEDEKKGLQDSVDALTQSQRYQATIDKLGEQLSDENKAAITNAVEKEYLSKVNAAYTATQTPTGQNAPVKIAGQDAVIELNGAEFTSGSNTFNINGLTVTAQKISEKDANGDYVATNINTTDDIDGIYNMVKDFIGEYNKLIKEINTLYNANSSKGYEPLLDEEKEAMSDDEIKKWEDKIKESLLRRDSSLNSVNELLKSSMMEGVEIGGKKVYLSDFGIELPSYFDAGADERNMYHIAGDKDDPMSAGKKDKLKSSIASDPERFKEFFSKFAQNLYDGLQKEMRSVKGTRSIYHVYDDKKMTQDYKDYEEKIKMQEEKLKRLEDRYYAQFTAMEKAMSQLNSSQSALASLMGQQ